MNTISKPQTDRVFDAPKTPGSGTFTSPGGDTSSDGVDLGSQSNLLAQTQAAGADGRAARIEQLRALVQSGQYQVDPVALSKSIVDAALSGD